MATVPDRETDRLLIHSILWQHAVDGCAEITAAILDAGFSTRDSARLDWLDSLSHRVRDANTWIECIGGTQTYVWDSTANRLQREGEDREYKSARDAIDAAMQFEKASRAATDPAAEAR